MPDLNVSPPPSNIYPLISTSHLIPCPLTQLRHFNANLSSLSSYFKFVPDHAAQPFTHLTEVSDRRIVKLRLP